MILKTLSKYIDDLFPSMTNKVIVIENTNYDKANDTDNLIVVGELVSNTISNNDDYNEGTDTETLFALMSGTFVINFYGENARTNAYLFLNKSKSQESIELQRDADITVYRPTRATNLTALEGNHFHKRYEVEINVRYTEVLELDRLSIETAEISYIFDK